MCLFKTWFPRTLRLQVSRAAVYKQLLENSLRVLLDKIPHLTEDRMLLLLNDSFR